MWLLQRMTAEMAQKEAQGCGKDQAQCSYTQHLYFSGESSYIIIKQVAGYRQEGGGQCGRVVVPARGVDGVRG